MTLTEPTELPALLLPNSIGEVELVEETFTLNDSRPSWR